MGDDITTCEFLVRRVRRFKEARPGVVILYEAHCRWWRADGPGVQAASTELNRLLDKAAEIAARGHAHQ